MLNPSTPSRPRKVERDDYVLLKDDLKVETLIPISREGKIYLIRNGIVYIEMISVCGTKPAYVVRCNTSSLVWNIFEQRWMLETDKCLTLK